MVALDEAGPAVPATAHGLPPGQRAVRGFPRFGTHLHRPPPVVPEAPSLEVTGAVQAPARLPLPLDRSLRRRQQVADFHCVAGWSATGLLWEGVPFHAFYREVIEPAVRRDELVTHLVFEGLDGYRSVALLEDALAEDVLLADGLNGKPLEPDHGAPLRLVSPSQYGFVSTKHLCRIEVHTTDPREGFGAGSVPARRLMLPPLFKRHPRSRVWHEERNPALPAWLIGPIYRLLTPPIRWLSARGAKASSSQAPPR